MVGPLGAGLGGGKCTNGEAEGCSPAPGLDFLMEGKGEGGTRQAAFDSQGLSRQQLASPPCAWPSIGAWGPQGALTGLGWYPPRSKEVPCKEEPGGAPSSASGVTGQAMVTAQQPGCLRLRARHSVTGSDLGQGEARTQHGQHSRDQSAHPRGHSPLRGSR